MQQRKSQEDEARRHHHRAVPETIDLEAVEEVCGISPYKLRNLVELFVARRRGGNLKV